MNKKDIFFRSQLSPVFYSISFFFLLFPFLSLAQPFNPPCPEGANRLCNPLKAESFKELASQLLQIVVAVGIPIAIFFFVLAGFYYVTAQGDESKVTKAHKTFLWTTVGALVLVGAQLLALVLQGTVEEITGRPLGI